MLPDIQYIHITRHFPFTFYALFIFDKLFFIMTFFLSPLLKNFFIFLCFICIVLGIYLSVAFLLYFVFFTCMLFVMSSYSVLGILSFVHVLLHYFTLFCLYGILELSLVHGFFISLSIVCMVLRFLLAFLHHFL